ncbi:MAG: class I SAM-dependent methyltransferase [Marinilabiliaceae bacterium]
MSFYQSIAPYYDYIFPPSEAQLAFVKKETGGWENKRILEAGCGTGNLARMLTRQGAKVEGIDLDGEMIGKAREKSGGMQNVQFRQLDILDVDEVWPASYFHSIVSFGNTLVHLSGLSEMASFFEKARKLLKPGGRLLVQIIHYDRILDQKIEGLPTIENEHIRFERFYDFVENGSKINFRTVLTVKATGDEICNEVRLYPVRREQLRRALTSAGFSDIRFLGNFNGDSLTENSVPLIFTAKN